MLTTLFNGLLPKGIFFDLDGTLVDSLPDLSLAIDEMLTDLAFPVAGISNSRRWVGNGAKALVHRALAHAHGIKEEDVTNSELAVALTIFLKKYSSLSGTSSKLYPGVIETLHVLHEKGVKLCIITNKPQQFTPELLLKHKLSGLFELVLSGDTLAQKKPDPAPLLHALQVLHLEKSQTLMVGDSKSDISAANSAGLKSVCVTYGYNHGADPLKLPASAHINSFSELLA